MQSSKADFQIFQLPHFFYHFCINTSNHLYFHLNLPPLQTQPTFWSLLVMSHFVLLFHTAGPDDSCWLNEWMNEASSLTALNTRMSHWWSTLLQFAFRQRDDEHFITVQVTGYCTPPPNKDIKSSCGYCRIAHDIFRQIKVLINKTQLKKTFFNMRCRDVWELFCGKNSLVHRKLLMFTRLSHQCSNTALERVDVF